MRIKLSTAFAGVSGLALAVPVCAQEVPSDSGFNASEIVVQARRRDESIQDVPLVVNAVTSQQIEKLNLRDFTEVQNLVPGLLLGATANGTGANAQIRGVQYDINTGANPSIAFYQNDSLIDGTTMLQAMYDIESIQVLRGPQGTLRGQASPSGSIVVTTRKPNLEEAGGTISMTGNTIGGMNVNAGLGVPIIRGIAAIRVAGVWDENEGNRVRTIGTGGDRADPHNKTRSGRVSLRIEPADWLRLEGVYQHVAKQSRGFDQYASLNLFNPAIGATSPVIRPSDRQSIQTSPRTFDQNFDVYNWRAEVRQAGQALIYQGSRQDSLFIARTNQDNADFLPNRDIFQDSRTQLKVTVHEVRLQSEERIAGIFDYVVGFNRVAQTSTINFVNETPVLVPLSLTGGTPFVATVATTPISIIPSGKTTEQSFFGNVTAHLGTNTELSGGLRRIRARGPASVFSVAGSNIAQPRQDDDAWIYSASIKQQISPDFMVYASTGTSRRVGPNVIGDFSVRRSAVENSFLFLPPEKSESYEVGFKSNWLDNRVTFNLTAYHQKFRNYPFRNQTGIFYVNYAATVANGAVSVTPGVGQFNFVAPVPVEVNGVEGELHFAVTPRWSLDVTASYALGKIKNGLAPCNDLNGDGVPDAVPIKPTLAQLQALVGANNLATCRINQRSSFQSPFSATVQTEFTQPVSNRTEAFARGLLTYNGNSQADPQYRFDDFKAAAILSLYAGVRGSDGQWELALFAKNLFNKTRTTRVGTQAFTDYQELVPPAFQTTVAATALSNYTQISTDAPREFGLNFRFAFGSR